MRTIPFIILGIITVYFYLILSRVNIYFNLKISKFIILFILFLLILPATNFFGIWFLTLIHLFEIGILIEVLNFFLKNFEIKKWDVLYHSFFLPIIIVILIFSYGYYNVNNIKRTEYNINTKKNICHSGYKIGLISDIHFGNALNEKNIKKYIKELNQENFDILILAGDIIDESSSLKNVKDIFKILGSIKTKKGIYYTLGNHDESNYTKNPNYTLKELENILNNENIFLLRDEIKKVNNDLVIVGRKDKSHRKRLSSEFLIKNLDLQKYLILVDHQPVELEKNSRLGYDLQLSGHTHNGQIFPTNILIKFFNLAELIYGNKKIDNLNVIVSSGFSGWGYPIRTAGVSEYVVINITKAVR